MAEAAASTPPAPAAPAALTPPAGLSSAQVAERRSRGLTNAGGERTSRSVAEILRANILTRFNLILGVLLAVILVAGQPQDALFGIVLVTNALIGIGQEVRAKRTLDRLAVLSAPRVRVIRDGAPRDIAVDELVADDLVDLRAGDQLVADGVVRASASMQADESLLTGESEPVDKRAGDQLLSGSFVVAGSGGYQATGVGAEAYARKLAAQARRFTLVRSELVAGINQILRYVTWAIPPVAVLLILSQLHTGETRQEAAISTVAALVGMVPQGLVLLTSIAFGAAAVTLARRRVLVQQLPAVEGLARVDVVCFDKTGTLTDGTITFDSLIRLDDQAPAEAALGALADDQARNATLAAIGQAFPPPRGWTRQAAVPFSSARKWSAASFAGHGTWVLGAPEMVLPGSQDGLLSRAADLAASGRRVLALACAPGSLDGQALPAGLRAVAFILLAERLRSDALATIAYFAAQGVALKVISGDSPRTAGAVAARAGVPKAGDPVDARDLPEDPGALGALLEERSVYGRVTPHQKESMVKALQARGHTVAMTGDGVNDVLALKLADIGVAMGSGAAATKAVADLILLDNGFATLPGVVAEDRTRRQPVRHQDGVGDAARGRRGRRPHPVPVPAPPSDDHRHPGHRRPRVLPRARAEPPALPAWFRRPGAAVHRPGRVHHRRRDVRSVRPRAGTRTSPDRAAHGRDPGHAHPQPVRARPAGDAADLAQDRAARRRARRIRAAVPRARRAHLLRTRAAARRDRQHAAHRPSWSRRARRLLGPLPPARPQTSPGGRK
jgi:cation-transporting ATPase E